MFARTPRLLLRPGWMEDARALTDAIGHDAVLRNLARAPSPYTLADAEVFLGRPQLQSLPRLLAFTRTLGAPRLVGGCGIHRDADGAPELGYWIARPYWGLGFATEAARAVLGIARAMGHADLRARHFADNPASGNVLRKLGFRFTGRVERQYSPGRNAEADSLLFEQGEEDHMAPETASELYGDAMPGEQHALAA
jgi:RimJ/RimL family protein N-acetyltransferase